ncbi:MAG TPA: hypothetical protein VMX17_14130, partial [Candidatus Glassbacteria bacterium]|nr:hypothetical protein [Candidatus Glassbacteria bacterium]
YKQVTRKYKLSWNEFRKKCGVDVTLTRMDLSLEDLMEEYKAIIEEHGEKAYSSPWMRKNGYEWIYTQSIRKHKLSWNEFRKKCGVEFKSKFESRDLSLDDLIEEYQPIIKEHGEKAYSSGWIIENGYKWIYKQINEKHKIPWSHFVQMCKPEIEMEFSW